MGNGATGQRLSVDRVVTEVGSAVNGKRREFLALLRDRSVSTIVVERRDRFVRFGAEYAPVVGEGLHVAGMVKNRRLARHVADCGFGEIRRQLAYKTARHGGAMIAADRWFSSSKTCSECAVRTAGGVRWEQKSGRST